MDYYFGYFDMDYYYFDYFDMDYYYFGYFDMDYYYFGYFDMDYYYFDYFDKDYYFDSDMDYYYLAYMDFSKSGLLVEGIMLSISSGTFIYVSTSEVIVEEFSSKGSKYLKFLFYLMGGLLTVLLNILQPAPMVT